VRWQVSDLVMIVVCTAPEYEQMKFVVVGVISMPSSDLECAGSGLYFAGGDAFRSASHCTCAVFVICGVADSLDG